MESEAIVRLVVVAAVTLAIVLVARIRPSTKPAPLNLDGSLEAPGVHLFTSETCDSCGAAREVYKAVLGPDGFIEHSWEEEPELLERLAVEEIPVSTVLNRSGHEVAAFRLIPGRRALRRAARAMLR